MERGREGGERKREGREKGREGGGERRLKYIKIFFQHDIDTNLRYCPRQ